MANFVNKGDEPPPLKVINLCEKSRYVNQFCEKFHIKQISHDYHQMLSGEKNTLLRNQIIREYRMEVTLALLRPFGITLGTALILDYLTSHMILTLFVITTAIAYYLTR